VEQKIKFIIIGLAGILVISLLMAFMLYNAKEEITRERDMIKKENLSLNKKVEEVMNNNRQLQEQLKTAGDTLARVAQEKDEVQKKLDFLDKEKNDLNNKLQFVSNRMKEQSREQQTREPVAGGEDAYWAGILKAKSDLEMQLRTIRDQFRDQLNTMQLNGEQLNKDKNALTLEVNSLTRDRDDFKRQFEYNQKVMDSIAQELVREKNDKFKIQSTLNVIKNENIILKRQLDRLNNRKLALEHKLVALQKDSLDSESKVRTMDALLRNNLLQVDNLKKQIESVDVKSGRSTSDSIPPGTRQSVELAPIVVRPQETLEETQGQGKVLAVNKDSNFVIMDLGEDAGINMGDTFQVYRDDKPIAIIEVTQVRKKISACDIKKESSTIRAGDTVR